jgi:hypothetical protein
VLVVEIKSSQGGTMYGLYTLIGISAGVAFLGGVIGYYKGKYDGKREEARKIRETGVYSIRERDCLENALKIESALRKNTRLAKDAGLEERYLADILKGGHVTEKEYYKYVDYLHKRVEEVLKNNIELAKKIEMEN